MIALGHVGRSLLLGILLLQIPFPLQAAWETLEGCRLIQNPGNDADSFHVRHRGKEYIFRLYYVDAPETSTMFPGRVKDQAAAFGISPSRVVPLGRDATEFSHRLLYAGPFTVHTLWDDARGRSRLPRYYAIIETGSGSLGEILVSAGYARLHGYTPNSSWPGGPLDTWDYKEDLKRLRKKAREGGFGAWGGRKANLPPAARDHPAPTPRRSPALAPPSSDPDETSSDKLNVNAASSEDLQRIPRIGPVLAGRIIENRPYRQLRELLQVEGIGEVAFRELEGHFRTYDGIPPIYTSDFYALNPANWVNRNVTVFVDYVETMEKEETPDGYSVLWANTSNNGVGGGGITVFFPEEMRDDFKRHFGSRERFLQASEATGQAPPKALTAGFFAVGGQFVLVVRRPVQ